METSASILTARLGLMKPDLKDAERLARLANDKRIADSTAAVPYPYTVDIAQRFISSLEDSEEKDNAHVFGLYLRDEWTLIGVLSVRRNVRHSCGELGYWLGADYRGHGYMTEAASSAIKFGFSDLGLNRMQGRCFKTNTSSASVLLRAGLKYEGCTEGSFLKTIRIWTRIYTASPKVHGEPVWDLVI